MLSNIDQLWSEIACSKPGQSVTMRAIREEDAIFALEGTRA